MYDISFSEMVSKEEADEPVIWAGEGIERFPDAFDMFGETNST